MRLERATRPAIRHREPRRRRRHDRRGGGRQSGARRLHILHDATAFSVNASLYPNLPFDYRKDFDPVFLVSLVPNILVVTPSVPVKTVADVIAFAKASPDGINMASSGNGTLQHLCLEMFKQRDRHQDQSRALSRRRSGADRCHGGPGEVLLRQRLVGGRLDQGRQSESHRAYRQRPACEPAGYSAGVRLRCRGSKPSNGTACSFRTARPPPSCRSSMPASTRRSCRRKVTARFAELNVAIAAEHAGRIRRLRRRPDAALEPRRQGSQHQARLMKRSTSRRALPGRCREPKRPRLSPPPGAWDSHFHIFGPSDKFPYAPGRGYTPPDAPVERLDCAARPSRLRPRPGRCRAMRTATTIAWCSMRWQRFPQRLRGVAITDTRIAPQDVARLASDSACAGCAFICFRKNPITCAASASTCSRCSARPWPSSAGSCRFFCDHRMLGRRGARRCATLSREMPVIVDHLGMVPAAAGARRSEFPGAC